MKLIINLLIKLNFKTSLKFKYILVKIKKKKKLQTGASCDLQQINNCF